MKTLEELQTLSDDELRVMLAGLCGVEPRKAWQFAYDATGEHRAVGMRSKEDAESCRQNQIANWQDFYGPCTIQEVEEYEEWDQSPNYPRDLNACHEVEVKAIHTERDNLLHHLKSQCGEDWGFAPPRERTIALILCLQPQ